MNISIGTTFNYDISLDNQLPLISEAGFTHISLGAGNLEHSGFLQKQGRARIIELLRQNDLKICSIHAPFFADADLSSPDSSIHENALAYMKRAIEAAAELDSSIVIFHPCSFASDHLELRKHNLITGIKALVDELKNSCIRLAIENLPSPPSIELLTTVLESIQNESLGFCFDTSHDNLTRQPMELLKKFGHRLFTTHISDNRGSDDDHMLPFEGNYPWQEFCSIFSAITFQGIFLLEVEMRKSSYTEPGVFLKEAYSRGNQLLEY